MLSHITWDYLAIQGSSIASECAFSSSWLTGTYLRNHLKTNTFEALQIVKSANCNGIINASDEVEAHVAVKWDLGGLVDTEDASDPV